VDDTACAGQDARPVDRWQAGVNSLPKKKLKEKNMGKVKIDFTKTDKILPLVITIATLAILFASKAFGAEMDVSLSAEYRDYKIVDAYTQSLSVSAPVIGKAITGNSAVHLIPYASLTVPYGGGMDVWGIKAGIDAPISIYKNSIAAAIGLGVGFEHLRFERGSERFYCVTEPFKATMYVEKYTERDNLDSAYVDIFGALSKQLTPTVSIGSIVRYSIPFNGGYKLQADAGVSYKRATFSGFYERDNADIFGGRVDADIYGLRLGYSF
jgi:hypothetical protein